MVLLRPPTAGSIGGLTAGRVVFVNSGGFLTDDAGMTFNSANDFLTLLGGVIVQKTSGTFVGALRAADAEYRLQFNIDAGGTPQILFGDGTSADVNLYRSAANTLKSDDEVQSAVDFKARAGTARQVIIGSDGANAAVVFGSATDTKLYRGAAGVLKTDGVFQAVDDVYANLDGTGRIRLNGSGGVPTILFGDLADVSLYRSAADVLKTDDAFHVALAFRHLGATLGFYNAAAVAQAADMVAFTSVGASANHALVDVATVGVADPAKINANFDDVADGLNLIRTCLRNLGLMA